MTIRAEESGCISRNRFVDTDYKSIRVEFYFSQICPDAKRFLNRELPRTSPAATKATATAAAAVATATV
jgi:hypothetical protein